MKKRQKPVEEPYVDLFLFEVGFFKDKSERQRMLDGVRKLNERLEREKQKRG